MRYFSFLQPFLLLFVFVVNAQGFKIVEFTSADDLLIIADMYESVQTEAPYILLCHQASFSRGAYREIVPQLNQLGFYRSL